MEQSNCHVISSRESHTRNRNMVYVVTVVSLLSSIPTLLLTNLTSCGSHAPYHALLIFRTLRAVCFYLIPVLIIFLSYCNVYKKLRQHINTRSRNSINPIVERERRAQKLITALGFVFTVTWGSYHASKIFANLQQSLWTEKNEMLKVDASKIYAMLPAENEIFNRNAFRKKKLTQNKNWQKLTHSKRSEDDGHSLPSISR